ncbi:MAG: hypothetical protein NVS9B1_11060 [Candidatus Dormibacteraceae bacterium]
MNDGQAYLDLVDWRRRVGDLYRLSGPEALDRFRRGRDELFATHPQSPLTEAGRAAFTGIDWFPANLALRLACHLEPAPEADEMKIDSGGEDGVITYRRAGLVRFRWDGAECRLTVLKQVGYGGGLFLPFQDATSGKETYGGGRYLFDTVKNTDGLALVVAARSAEVTIDFNYAYNPSCAYNPRWACPLSPPENRLSVPIRAGERVYAGESPNP